LIYFNVPRRSLNKFKDQLVAIVMAAGMGAPVQRSVFERCVFYFVNFDV
jgi:hypothetical protein